MRKGSFTNTTFCIYWSPIAMASKTPSRLLRPLARKTSKAASPSSQLCPLHQARRFTTSTPLPQDAEVQTQERPRWQHTPPAMKAPFRSKPPPRGPQFKVNDDPGTLDQVYVQVLGDGGDAMLAEDVKWLAVTHKSFDHGRRGFNDRLAFLGTLLAQRFLQKLWRRTWVWGIFATKPLTLNLNFREKNRRPPSLPRNNTVYLTNGYSARRSVGQRTVQT